CQCPVWLMPQSAGGATSTTQEGMEFPADFNEFHNTRKNNREFGSPVSLERGGKTTRADLSAFQC
ncbi:MAG: hypothetical protein ACYT04_96100, partial [Nostoc sp.]